MQFKVLDRMHQVLLLLNERMKPLADDRTTSPLVLMYGHSMAGAALAILLGSGKVTYNLQFKLLPCFKQG